MPGAFGVGLWDIGTQGPELHRIKAKGLAVSLGPP